MSGPNLRTGMVLTYALLYHVRYYPTLWNGTDLRSAMPCPEVCECSSAAVESFNGHGLHLLFPLVHFITPGALAIRVSAFRSVRYAPTRICIPHSSLCALA
eukprot:3826963-Rhodomonas_salina.2